MLSSVETSDVFQYIHDYSNVSIIFYLVVKLICDPHCLNLMSTDCSHEIKRHLLGRKALTNLDSIFKSRDITLPTKVHLVKAMVFPVVMYGCESWTMKNPGIPISLRIFHSLL